MRQRNNRTGFTLVEVLIVIVVIAILASISTVSYRGSQARARASKAKANATAVKQVAESYYSQANTYPTSVSHFTAAVSKLPADVTILTSGSLTKNNGESSILYKYVGSVSNATGACVLYWDFAPSSGSPRASTPLYIGTATSSNCSATVGAFPAS